MSKILNLVNCVAFSGKFYHEDSWIIYLTSKVFDATKTSFKCYIYIQSTIFHKIQAKISFPPKLQANSLKTSLNISQFLFPQLYKNISTTCSHFYDTKCTQVSLSALSSYIFTQKHYPVMCFFYFIQKQTVEWLGFFARNSKFLFLFG